MTLWTRQQQMAVTCLHWSEAAEKKPNTRLFSYRRQEELWRMLPNDRQLMVLTQEKVRIKTQLLVGMEATKKEFTDHMGRLTPNVKY